MVYRLMSKRRGEYTIREMAFANRKAQDGLIFYSDQGVQYCAKSFRAGGGRR
jgi:transposase InsO family protein